MSKLAYIIVAIALGVLNTTQGVAAEARYDKSRFSQKPTRCDQLAAYPPDRDRVVAGINRDQINVPDAISACETDVKADPYNPRLHYQLARLFGYQKNDIEAAQHRQVAIDAGYPIAIFVSGYERAFGPEKDRDRCGGAALIVKAARLGAYAAQIGITAYIMSSEFKDCPNLVTQPELLSFLEAARLKTEGHFETLLIESLSREVSARSAQLNR